MNEILEVTTKNRYCSEKIIELLNCKNAPYKILLRKFNNNKNFKDQIDMLKIRIYLVGVSWTIQKKIIKEINEFIL